MVLPAAMSSSIQPATRCQPAACQISNGPWFQPKPQRTARSRSRALSAMLGQVKRAVVQHVAERRPQELRLRMLALAQLLEAFGESRVLRISTTAASASPPDSR